MPVREDLGPGAFGLTPDPSPINGEGGPPYDQIGSAWGSRAGGCIGAIGVIGGFLLAGGLGLKAQGLRNPGPSTSAASSLCYRKLPGVPCAE